MNPAKLTDISPNIFVARLLCLHLRLRRALQLTLTRFMQFSVQ